MKITSYAIAGLTAVYGVFPHLQKKNIDVTTKPETRHP